MQNITPVEKFTDYRAFLIAHAQDMKKINPKWTYGSWVKRLNLKTTSSITKIINGDREPGREITQKLIQYFKFKDKESVYFQDLIRLHKIKKDPRLSVLLMEKMSKEHPNGAIRILDDKTFSIISNWYYLVIREMTRMEGFLEDSEWISKKLQFKVTSREIRQAIDALLKVGLLKRDKNNSLQIAEGRTKTSDDIASEAIRRFHEQMLENAKISLRLLDVNEREFTSATLVMKINNIREAKEFIREFRKKFSKIFEEEKGDVAYQLQIQLFPLTKREIEE